MFSPIKRKMRLLALASFLLTSPALAASGSIVIIGSGEAATAPEVARLSVHVTSLCYDTSRGAKDANAVLANTVLALLRSFASDPLDRVTASGGANTRQTEYAAQGGTTRTLCEMKWRATNTLTISTGALDTLADLQDALLNSIDASAIDPQAVAQTYAELTQPDFSLRETTLRDLRAKAQTAAYDDAKAQFDVFASRCAFQDAQLTSISPPQYDVYPRVDGRVLDTAAGGSTPIVPDDINVKASWRFEWSFTPTGSCRR